MFFPLKKSPPLTKSTQSIDEDLDSVLQTLISLHLLEWNATLCGRAAEKTEDGRKKSGENTFSCWN